MSEEKLVRLENLRLVLADRSLGPADLVRDLGSRYSFWRDLLAGDKSFGEKLARRIEQKLELPGKWLDTPQTQPPAVALFRDLDPFESQLVTLFRQMGPDTQHDTLTELNNKVSAKSPNASTANPFKTLGLPTIDSKKPLRPQSGGLTARRPAAKKQAKER